MLQRPVFAGALFLSFALVLITVRVGTVPIIAGINDLTQQDYRWYANLDASQPTTSLAVENTPVTGSAQGTVYHLRVNVLNSVSDLNPGSTFKLQYSTSTSGPWTDVGGFGSGVAWRGYDNPTPADGDTLPSNLLGSSHAPASETYEEANTSAPTPNIIRKDKAGEWGWVIQHNAASGGTTYYFRMVQGDGTGLAGYTNYPEVATAVPSPLLSQEDYRWYQNADAVQPTTGLAAENTPLANTVEGNVYRLRMNLEDSAAQLPAGELFKLQYGTSISGPWTDVGGVGSAEVWRGYDNPTPIDGSSLSTVLLTTSNLVETYEEANISAGAPNAIAVGQRGEWDWVAQQNGAGQNTTYYFQMVKSDGTSLSGYTRYPTLTTAGPQLDQDSYRWYQNSDAIQPITALAAENSVAIGVATAEVARLRLSLAASTIATAAGESFKLQYAISTGGPWTDVGGVGSAEIWRGLDNATPVDGATITANLLSGGTILQTYEEANPSGATPNAVTVGNSAEWDWVLENNGAAESTAYFFRTVYSDGTGLNTYTLFPQLTTAAGASVLDQLQYRWYENTNAVQPITALAGENTVMIGSPRGTVYHLRMNIDVSAANLGTGATFKLQFATSTGGPWSDVGGLGSSAEWRGYNNPTPADGATLSSNLLSGSHAPAKETYEEANPSSPMPNSINSGKAGEWAWVAENNATAPGTTYYFRMVRGDGSALDSYTTYPEIATPGVTIAPDNSDSGPPNSIVSYSHTVTNTGRGNDTFDITKSSSAGWTVDLYQADGVTPLPDTDLDTTPDTGSLAPSGSVNIVVKVTIGWSATNDSTLVSSVSSVDTGVQSSATDTTTAPPTITLNLGDTTLAMGSPDPNCEDNPDGTAVGEFTVYNGTAGNQGCAYTWSPLAITVDSNRPWTGTVAGSDGTPTSGVTVALGNYRYDAAAAALSYPGCAGDAQLPTTPGPFESSGSEGSNQVYNHHHCVVIDWDDNDGTIDSTITYTVSQ